MGPIYLATIVVYTALVGVGFFSPSPEVGAEGLQLPDTPHLLIAAFALAVAAAKMFRLAGRPDGEEIRRRDGLEAGALLVILVSILDQSTGGANAYFFPLQYLTVALLAAHTDLPSSLAFASFAAGLAVAPAYLAGEVEARTPELVAHAATLLAFAFSVGSFLRMERGSRLDAVKRLARFQGDTDALEIGTEDIDSLKEERSLAISDRARRLRELKNELDGSIHEALLLAKDALSAHTVLLLRHDSDGDRLEVADAISDSDHLVEAPLDAREGVFAGAIKSRQTVTLGDIRASAVSYYLHDEGVRSVLVTPLLQGSGVSGLIVADHLQADRYGKAQASVLAGIARLIGNLEHGGRERERHAKFQDRLRHLLEVSKVLQDTLSPEELAKRMLSLAGKLATFEFAVVAVATGGADERFTIQTATGVDSGRLAGKDAPTTDTLVGWVLRNRVYLKAERFRSRTVKTALLGRRLDPDGLRAALVFPMLRQDSVIGACVFGSFTRDTFTNDEFEMLESAVSQTSLAMSNAVLHEQTVEMATTDGLTGLNNRRYFQDTMLRESERAQRNPNTRFAMVISDIDHFKQVNDNYGHPMGDEVLRRVGRILKAAIQRKTDFVARYGGEEFVLVLADTDAAGARGVIDKIRAAVARESFEFEGRAFRINMSAGIAAYPDDVVLPAGATAEDLKTQLVEHADRALYHSKENGRNRSTLWSAIASSEAIQPAASVRG